jgi:hypothetical protein
VNAVNGFSHLRARALPITGTLSGIGFAGNAAAMKLAVLISWLISPTSILSAMAAE